MIPRAYSYSIALLLCMGMLAGCSPREKTDPTALPSATISDAKFKFGQPYTVVITGEFFKIKSDNKEDVIASLNGRNWAPAKSISDSSPTSYTAILPYGISFPQVWVRVYGLNGEYSSPFQIQGQRR